MSAPPNPQQRMLQSRQAIARAMQAPAGAAQGADLSGPLWQWAENALAEHPLRAVARQGDTAH